MPQSQLDVHLDEADPARTAAMRRAQAKIELLRHVTIYVVVIGALAAINLTTSREYLWFVWPAAGWGIGLFVHAVNVFAFTDRLVQRMVDRELRRSERSPESDTMRSERS